MWITWRASRSVGQLLCFLCRMPPTLDLTDIFSSWNIAFMVCGRRKHFIQTAPSEQKLIWLTLTWTAWPRQLAHTDLVCLSEAACAQFLPCKASSWNSSTHFSIASRWKEAAMCSLCLGSCDFRVTSLKAECLNKCFHILLCGRCVFPPMCVCSVACLHHESLNPEH